MHGCCCCCCSLMNLHTTSAAPRGVLLRVKMSCRRSWVSGGPPAHEVHPHQNAASSLRTKALVHEIDI
eukprot:scaffold312101_cov14-Tisochrysis_lutea.AAC.1